MKEKGVVIEKDTAYRALQKADREINGDPHDGYKFLESWCRAAEVANPGTKWHIADKDGRFCHLFLAFGPCIDGAKHCPQGFGVTDGCSLKGYYVGNFLTLLGMDASGREFPVAFAITGNESKKTWGWFFDKCRSTLGEDFFNGYALMSDQQKGLDTAMKKSFPQAKGLKCSAHMERNIKVAFKSKEAVSKFKKLRMTSSEERYEEVFDTLDPEFQEYLKGKDPTSWATCQIRARNYGHTTSNLAESFNASLSKIRAKSILGLLNGLLGQLSRWFYERHMEDTGNDDGALQHVQDKVEALNAEASRYDVIPASKLGEVHEGIPITLSCKNIQTNIVL